jgi:TfoX/Sxy family transcriptional regulator of competence genes
MPEMPKFTKSPPGVVAAFDGASPSRAGVERRTMFGCPALFLNGNMFAFAFGPRIAVRLGASARARAAKAGATPFEMMPGKPMGEYIEVPRSATTGPALRKWMADGLDYAETLPSKAAKTKKVAVNQALAAKPTAKKTTAGKK